MDAENTNTAETEVANLLEDFLDAPKNIYWAKTARLLVLVLTQQTDQSSHKYASKIGSELLNRYSLNRDTIQFVARNLAYAPAGETARELLKILNRNQSRF